MDRLAQLFQISRPGALFELKVVLHQKSVMPWRDTCSF